MEQSHRIEPTNRTKECHQSTDLPWSKTTMEQIDEDGSQQDDDDNRQEQEYDNWKTS